MSERYMKYLFTPTIKMCQFPWVFWYFLVRIPYVYTVEGWEEEVHIDWYIMSNNSDMNIWGQWQILFTNIPCIWTFSNYMHFTDITEYYSRISFTAICSKLRLTIYSVHILHFSKLIRAIPFKRTLTTRKFTYYNLYYVDNGVNQVLTIVLMWPEIKEFQTCL